MANVPYDPTVQNAPSATPPNDYLNVNATPASFGGLLASGEAHAAQGLNDVGHIFNQVAADDQTNKYMPALRDLQVQYEQLPDEEKMRQYKNYQQQSEDVRNKLRDDLPAMSSRLQFDADTRRMQNMYLGQFNTQMIQASKQYAVNVSNTRYQNNLDLIAANPNMSDEQIQNVNNDMLSAKVKKLQMIYDMNSPTQAAKDALSNARLDVARDTYSTKIIALAGKNPIAAQEFFNQPNVQAIMRGSPNYSSLLNHVDSAATNVKAVPAAQEIVSASLQGQYDQTTATPNAPKQIPEPNAKYTDVNYAKGPITPVAQKLGLSPEDTAIGNMIASKEGGTANIGYGGKQLDISNGFPKSQMDGVVGPTGEPTHAAGFFQFQPATWNAAARLINANPNDFSPENQTKVGIAWAKKTYSDQTEGRDLAADMKNGTVDTSALASQWASFGGGGSGSAKQLKSDLAGAEANALAQAQKQYGDNPQMYSKVESHIKDTFGIMRFAQQQRQMQEQEDNNKAIRSIGDVIRNSRGVLDPTIFKQYPNLPESAVQNLTDLATRTAQAAINGDPAHPGDSFGQVMSDISAGKVINQEQLISYSKNGQLTDWGFHVAQNKLAEFNAPHAANDKATYNNFLDDLRSKVILPGVRDNDLTQDDRKIWSNATMEASTIIDQMKTDGKKIQDIVAPDSDLWKQLKKYNYDSPERAADINKNPNGVPADKFFDSNGEPTVPAPQMADPNAYKALLLQFKNNKGTGNLGGAINDLFSDPSEENKKAFNKYFGPGGKAHTYYNADELLKRLRKPSNVQNTITNYEASYGSD